MPSREVCAICVDAMPPSRRVECPFCEHVSCKTCVQRYILGSADDPNCMNCHRRFDRELLNSKISQSFVNRELKQHRGSVLLERETAMMPGTQAYVNQELQRRNNVQLLSSLQAERAALKRKLHDLDQSCHHLQQQIVPPLETERRQFTHRCAQEDCRGYLSIAWRCNICEKYTCPECNAPRGFEREDGHVCNEADRESMRLIKNDSRKCPGCAEYIFKVSGCDQMWCTSCHTAFSWRTGHKINGTIHNPHFYEFQRHAGTLNRELGDVPCGGMPSYRELLGKIRQSRNLMTANDTELLIQMHRLTSHVVLVEIPRYNAVAINAQSNLDLRISFMLNELTTDAFKEKLQQREKKAQKKQEIGMILNMFVQTMSDFYRQAILDDSYAQQVVDIRALIQYFNKSLKQVSQKFACVVPHIHEESFRLISNKA